MSLVRWASLVPLLVASACGSSRGTQVHDTRAAAREAQIDWTTRLGRDHPLVGRIWDVAGQRFVSQDELTRALVKARLVVLGEKHDNPDHHRLQARLVEGMVARGRRPALVFEMIDASRQPALERARAAHPRDADALAIAVDWAESGWPPFEAYRPVLAAAVRAELPIVAAGLDRAAAMRLVHGGVAALDPELVRSFDLAAPLPPEQDALLREEMRAAHCGMLPDAMLGAMVGIQRARDAQFAARLHAAANGSGAVLIAGNGHARSDRGVPAQLAHALSAPALSVGLLEVHGDLQTPAGYAEAFGGDTLPFDYAWFTPRATDADPCESLRRRHGTGSGTETDSESDSGPAF